MKHHVHMHEPNQLESGDGQRGAALVIVLGMVVLLTVLVVAFFSRALMEQRISHNSANQTKVDIFAQGAIEAIQADLKQQIMACSSITTMGGTVNLYRPNTPADAAPSRHSLGHLTLSGTDLPNLVGMSAELPLFASGTARASSARTTDASLNQRSVTMAAWNKPLLLPKDEPTSTNLTPSQALLPEDEAPRWILVARNGLNPAAWDDKLRADGGEAEVVGRYAFMIYNEGGLLDANAAGSPAVTLSGTRQKLWSRKGSVALADLTQLPGVTATLANQLTGWRNYANLKPDGKLPGFTISGDSMDNYLDYALNQTTRFLTVSGSLYQGQSDRRFTSRQQLIRFVTEGLDENSGDRATRQNVLQYLGTFNRSLNRPSYWPDPTRPRVMAPATPDMNSRYPGGNSAFQKDDQYNPPFAGVTATASGTRNDGSLLVTGEPLVQKRFALSRLLWLTYKGPSARINTSDDLFRAYLDTGIPREELERLWRSGTDENIFKYFGLVWYDASNQRGSTGLGGYWLYGDGYPNDLKHQIGTLAEVAASGREANFFELLQAAVNVGAIARTYSGPGTENPPHGKYVESQVELQIFQLAANIIDSAQPDNYPTRIVYDRGDIRWSYCGTVDLPYYYGAVSVGVLVSPAIMRDPTASPPLVIGTSSSDPLLVQTGSVPDSSKDRQLQDPGRMAAMSVPIIWNPNRDNSVELPAGLSPQDLRINVSNHSYISAQAQNNTTTINAMPRYSYDQLSRPPPTGTVAETSSYHNQDILGEGTGFHPSWKLGTLEAQAGYLKTPEEGSAGNTSLYFKNDRSLYREPTPLLSPAVLGGAYDLHIDGGNMMLTAAVGGNSDWKSGIPEYQSNNRYLGFFIGSFRHRWLCRPTNRLAGEGTTSDWFFSGSAAIYTTNNIYLGYGGATVNTGFTISMEYKAGGRWVPYRQVSGAFPGYHTSIGFTLDNDSASGDPYHRSLRWNWVNVDSPARDSKFTHSACLVIDPRSGRGRFSGDYDITRSIDAESLGNGKFGIGRQLETIRPGVGRTSAGSDPSVEFWSQVNTHGFYFGGLSHDSWISWNRNDPGDDSYTTMDGYNLDPDGVVRPGMGGWVPVTGPEHKGTTETGLPLATVNNTNTNGSSRPIILHRPFRSVAELGYVFSDSPWRNIDFSSPDSGYTALLDVFCVNEDQRPDALEAGRVDLNTRNQAVIKALLAGAYRDEFKDGGTDDNIIATQADRLADSLLRRTGWITGAGNSAPLQNIAELTGRWLPGKEPDGNTNGGGGSFRTWGLRRGYAGFSADLASTAGSTAAEDVVTRLREAPIRALADAGQAGTWNLLVDVVAQIGRYPASATTLEQFQVEGERRYWVHVAIDRVTGQIIDQQMEAVEQ